MNLHDYAIMLASYSPEDLVCAYATATIRADGEMRRKTDDEAIEEALITKDLIRAELLRRMHASR